MPFAESFDGNKIFYEISGEGQPIIFLSCVGAGVDFWKYQKPLSSKYKLFLIDTAGYGKSDKNRGKYTYSSFAQDVKAVIKKEKLQEVILVGHSFGGIIAIETAILLKEKIKGIIAIDSMIPYTVYYGRKATEEEITEVMKEYDGDYKNNYDNLIRGMLGDRVDEETKEWVVSIAGYDANDPMILKDMILTMLEHDYHEIISQVSCPIQYILRSLQSRIDEIKNEQKNAIIIDNVGHLMNIEQPQIFNEIIEKIIQQMN
ncbi:MAG: alpha/beta fold hydrolase [Candidatus Thorarchaeota archaeon]